MPFPFFFSFIVYQTVCFISMSVFVVDILNVVEIVGFILIR